MSQETINVALENALFSHWRQAHDVPYVIAEIGWSTPVPQRRRSLDGGTCMLCEKEAGDQHLDSKLHSRWMQSEEDVAHA